MTGAVEGEEISYTVSREAGQNVGEYAITVTAGENPNYTVTVENGTFAITPKDIKVTADDQTKVYDNNAETDPELTATVTGAVEGEEISYTLSREAGQDVGEYAITVTAGENPNYTVTVENGTFTIAPKAVTVTAIDVSKTYGDPDPELTATVEGLVGTDEIEYSLSRAEGDKLGSYDITPAGEAEQGNYIITYINGTLTVTWPEGDLVTKELTGFNGDLASYKITVKGEPLNEGEPLTLVDTFSGNQAINYASVEVAGTGDFSYDFSGNTGTYVIPDGVEVIITYTTRVKGSVGETVDFDNTAVLGVTENGSFTAGDSATVEASKTLSPTGSDIHGQDGVYTIDLFAYAQGHMERGLEGAKFRLLDSNMRPMSYKAGESAGQIITFETGADGYVTIALNEADHGLAIRKNTVYYLEMVTAPYEEIDGGQNIYYQKDNTFYSFMITDTPNYEYGGVYSYVNGDVLKVRCYPVSRGVNITKRFSGNYQLTDEQKKAIVFILQKEALDTATGWVDVESHTYADFTYGSMNFSTGREGGTELEDNATYRVIEKNALPEALEGQVSVNTTYTVAYQKGGEPVEDVTNEFFVDPDDKLAYSYDLTFTNQYVDNRLTLIKIDADTGDALPGAVFAVYAAADDAEPIKTYTTGDDGTAAIRRGDEGAEYAADTLYYVVETQAPEGWLLPDAPEKVYFYFSENGSAAPAGPAAVDLSTSFDTVTLTNRSDKVSVPVTVVWGVNGDEAWPEGVDHLVIGLYKSVDGGEPVAVLNDQDEPRTVTLNKTKYYDTSFKNLPAREDGKPVVYSVVEEHIYDGGGADITTQYARSSSVSGTGWYVVNNQAATSVTVRKEWYEIEGDTPIEDADDKAAVTFDLYRTTAASEATAFTRAELQTLLGGATPVRTGLTLAAPDWSLTVDSLEIGDKQGNPYHYYVLEHTPDNQEDTYAVEADTLTIKNRQTPVTVVITAADAEKTYGDDDPTWTFTAEVKQEGASVEIGAPDTSDNWHATVTAPSGATTDIAFTVARETGEDVGGYAITPSGDAIQSDYRVLFGAGTLTIDRANVTVTAGAEKTYGEADPDLVTVEGLIGDDTIVYTVSREEGQDVGEYPITLTGDAVQGNYNVTYVLADENDKPYVFTIRRATATVKAVDAEKLYGEDDPEFEVEIEGLVNDDPSTVIGYEVTRAAGEDVGDYTITPVVDAVQGNYKVNVAAGTLTIKPAGLTVTVQNADKIYGDDDPEWEIEISGLQRGEEGGELVSTLDEETGSRTYTYSVTVGEETRQLLAFLVDRASGENVGNYTLTPSGEATQGNYSVTYSTGGTLTIERAELTVIPNRVVKAVGITEDPLLTAEIEGWKNGDDTCNAASAVGEDGTITWTYTRGDDGAALLTFTLKRDPGEEEGEYPVAANGAPNQSNYVISYESGTFAILSILDVDVTQPLTDYADASANPSYSYTATLDLTGTGLAEYSKNGFETVNGVPTLSFTLPDGDGGKLMTLKIPGGAKLTVTQNTQDSENPDYTTAMLIDGAPYADPDGALTYTIDSVDTYHEIAFAHDRISLPVSARAAVGQTEEGATILSGRQGAMGIPNGVETIDVDFADEMHSKIGYALPTDKYYLYDHASLYTTAGAAIEGAAGVTGIQYSRETGKWQYRVADGEFAEVPENTQLVLFYLPKFVCKIGTVKFYSIREAVEYVEAHDKTAKIEMLIGDYAIRSDRDKVIIPEDCDITITTAETEYEGTGTAVISRSLNLTGGHLFDNKGTLKFDNIILDGKNVSAKDAMVLNEAELTVDTAATLRNASGVNGGAIYAKTGNLTVNGTLSNNAATYGGAVYVNGGEVGLGGSLSGNTATTGGAVYVNDGTVNVTATATGNKATSGGAIYIHKGEVGLAGTLIENEAASGGAVYQAGGTLTAGGSISQNTATGNGGAIYQAGGTLDTVGTLSGNKAANGGGIYRVGGTLTVGGTIENNTAVTNGGGIHTVGGTLDVSATLTGNGAANGGAIYISGATLNLNGGSISSNTASANGGAVCALNTATVIGGATLDNNTATANGGAFYMEGGSVTLQGTGKLNDNSAANGGGIYATSGAISVTGGEIKNNEAETSGGAVYAASATVTVGGGTISGNKATQGNGGAIYDNSGAVTISAGTLSGNSAANGKGGAVYAETGTVGFTGGTITTNSAVNGAAIFAGSGIANVSASITSNTATGGGAIGVGSASARLFFNGNAHVYDNKFNGGQRNVYLDVDSELVINAVKLNSGKKIGVYVPGDVDGDQVIAHGDVTGYFGAYTNTDNLGSFKNDRFSELSAAYENNRLYWINNLKYDIYYLASYSAQFPPTTNYAAEPSKKVCSAKSYAPRTRESNIYDLVMAMKLYETHNTDFTNNVGANYASMAVYAYTFSDKAMSNTFANYLQTVRWDSTARKWKYYKQDGTEAPANTSKLVIFYSAPAYLTIVNNNASGLALNISELTVLKKDVMNNGLYGFVTAKNGATAQTLMPIQPADLQLDAGESIKLMFPGAQGQSFVLKGEFTGEGASGSTGIEYTFNGGAKTPLSGTTVDFTSFKFNTSDDAAELIFGDDLPICKIGDVPFSTLTAAMDYAKIQKTATGNNKYTIEMLVDYLVPKDDVLDIPAGYDITFTTADRNAETLPFTGSGTRAILSRDTGNSGASVKAKSSTLTVDNLAFDGRSLTASGAGGAINTATCATVTIRNCLFSGYRADQGGAVYVDNTAAGSSLTVEDCEFSNCQTNASVDKAGGGGIWTTARELYVRNCTFDFCACLKGKAQAGSIFHNIKSGWSKDSKTVISDCKFSNSYSVGGSGGTIESDALDVTISDCEFHGSYTNKDKGNGGAINALAGDSGKQDTTGWIGTYNGECWLTVKNCLFDGCRAASNGNGGAIVSSMWYVTIEDCKFVNNQSKYGGAIRLTNSNAKWLHINGCTFENCSATGEGGGVSAAVPEIKVEASEGGTFLDGTENDGSTHFIDCIANRGGGIDNAKDDGTVTMENVNFTRCDARTSGGGAIYTQAKTLSITGDANTFTDCTGWGPGGAVYQNRSVTGSSVTLENCQFSGCKADNGGNGGGMYASAVDLTISGDGNGFSGCTAAKAGGGLYHATAGTDSIENCAFENCTASAETGGGLYTVAQSLTITGENSRFIGCTAQTDGGGIYHNRNAEGSSFTFRDGVFDKCTANGKNGGAIYTPAKSVTLADCEIKNSTAKSQGGGVYISPNTASFEGCTITDNSVTNSDSKGGGVYVAGGTTTYKNSTVSGCQAGNGGGWYQNNGNLYILGGSISGSATNGGGLYMNESNTKVYHYGGMISGTAAGNGGGVYKNDGTYTLGNGTYEEVAYTGARVGELTEGAYSATAKNGGGIYQNGGTVNLNAGAEVVGEASGSGGGIWNKSTVNHNGGYVNGTAANGGGVYQSDTSNGKYNFNGGTITGTATANGGAFYQAGNTFDINSGAVLGERTAGENTIASTADGNGGALYVAAGTATLKTGGSILGAGAANGGGAYVAGGTFTFQGGSMVRNTAAENGGGVYVADGKFEMKDGGAVIGGSEANANTANIGAGIFVADGKKATFDDGTAKTLEISYNHARTEGGGIAVGGPGAVLSFANAVTVRHNTMGADNTECNVYLDQDCNTVIQNGALNEAAYIGVYASDAQDEGHGQSGKPFGTYSNDSHLNVYRNDRRPYYYGVKGSNNLVIWPNFVCKITDGEGGLLYKDANGTPAVYVELENIANSKDNTAGAFCELNKTTPSLYKKGEDGAYTLYTENEYQVQMLAPNYEMGSTRQIKLNENVSSKRKITLTTASATPDECGFFYTGDPRFNATIKRTVDTYSLIYVEKLWELTLRSITLDGDNHKATENGGLLRLVGSGSAILDEGAILQNIGTSGKDGGAVYITDDASAFTMKNGSRITGCGTGTANGGAVCLNKGTFTMNGGAITGCSAANGGGVYMNNSAKFDMNGGEITGNNATSTGGGIAHNKDKVPEITFSGLCTVTGNTLNSSTRCNVQLARATYDIIKANGLDSRSEIGIYTDGQETATGSIYYNHGMPGKPFGTWLIQDDKLFVFVNDRNTNLRGFQSANETDTRIFWEYHPLLTVTKNVSSDLTYDQKTAEFTFQVQLPADRFTKNSTKYGDMTFNNNGLAIVKLKAGGSATAVLPDTFHMVAYEVTEVLSDSQKVDYTATAKQNGTDCSFTEEKPLTVSGTLGENIGTDNSTSLSEVVFTNTRETGDLTIKKVVLPVKQSDLEGSYAFTLTLPDDPITKTYAVTYADAANHETSGTLSFESGVADFTLSHDQSITIHGLPTDLAYQVEENLTERQQSSIRTQVQVDDVDVVSAAGTMGKTSNVVFTNRFLDIVCKITNRSRELLYIREANGTLSEAIFSHLEDAFDQINSGNLRTAGNGTVSGTLRIEMVVPEYAMERTATLNSGKTVILSTALTTDTDAFPYNKGVDDGNGNVSLVTREFDQGSMLTVNGTLTVDKITLDGASKAETPITAEADGGIINVASGVRLTLNSAAKLQNSSVTGNGGAIRLAPGASLTMGGAIENCSAVSGGGVYAEAGFKNITTTGSIAGCAATDGNGGAIFAASGAGASVNLNAGTRLTGNRASADGGAVWSGANVVLRGAVGGAETGEGNTAGGNGGGICLGENATFNMYTGSLIAGNTAVNGGGLYAQHTTRVENGTLSGNTATGQGGAIYAAEGAVVTLAKLSTLADNSAEQGGAVYNAGSLTLNDASITGNTATQGGAVYDAGSFTQSGGSMTGNTATEKGGAVYVAEGKRFTMTGGSVNGGNQSPEGAISTGSGAVLAFSGNSVVTGNTGSDGATPMNVYLGYDSNAIITTGGLGSGANIGVYVADGEPEDPQTEDAVDNPIYVDHGIATKNFATYTGTSIGSARLAQFVNDRDNTLHGMSGGGDLIAWSGKGIQLKVQKAGTTTTVSGVAFRLTNSAGTQVWSGTSNASGIVEIPWGGDEKQNGREVHFVWKSGYTLYETAASGDTVRPAGQWTLTIGRDNAVIWTTVPSETPNVNRTIAIGTGNARYLGDTFDLYNDVKPKVTYISQGATLRTDTVGFTTTDVYRNYTVDIPNPTANSRVFRCWATKPERPENGEGYYEYSRNDVIHFYRGGDSDTDAQGISKGDMTLYAQWEEVVCKITDRDGKLLYVGGAPAVYGTLEAGFEAYNTVPVFYYQNGSRATARRIEMLVGEYTLNNPVTLNRGKTAMLTTAPSTDKDGYPYIGENGPISVITRGAECADKSLITDIGALTLMNITLDGGSREVTCDGGLVNVAQNAATLTVTTGATLRNAVTTRSGGAVYVVGNASMSMTGGSITGNTGDNGAVCLAENAAMTMSGGSITGNTGDHGAVYVADKARMTMSGGSITGNTGDHGAISVGGDGARLTFSGNAQVKDNTRADKTTACNVYLDQDTNAVINSPGLGANAWIGVYVPTLNKDDQTPYSTRGDNLCDFGTYTGVVNLDHFHNDINALTGIARTDDKRIVWLKLVPTTVTKELVDLYGATNRAFTMSAAFAGKDQSYTYQWSNGTQSITLKEGDSQSKTIQNASAATDSNGRATLGSVVFNLPVGLPLTLAETAADLDYYTTAITGDSSLTKELNISGTTATFTIKEDSTNASVTVTNTRKTGQLKITKAVTSVLEKDKAAEFTFTVKLTGLSSTPKEKTIDGVKFVNGEARVTLKLDGNQYECSKVIKNLPIGVTYTVTEDVYNDFITDKPDGESGVISASTPQVKFTNTRKTGDLKVSKTMKNGTPADNDVSFVFEVRLEGLDDGKIPLTYRATMFDGSEESETETTFYAEGKASFQMKANQSITIHGLPKGVSYTVTEEADSDNKYVIESNKGYTGQISEKLSEAVFVNKRNSFTVKYVTDKDKGTIAGADADGNITRKVDYQKDTPFYREGKGPEVTAKSGYHFKGWDKTIAPKVTADVTYVAQYQKVVNITADKATKVYDGTPLTLTEADYKNDLPVGDKIQERTIIISGSQTDVGTSNSEIDIERVRILRNNLDVTDEYWIVAPPVELEVTAKPVTITADSDTKVYDGTALEKNSYTNTKLVDGHKFDSVTVTGSQTVVGKKDNVPSAAKIVDAGGKDVTKNYAVTYANGTLEVTPKAVTIKAQDASKTYDGKPLTESGFTATALEPGDSHAFTVTMTKDSTITDVGTQPNVIATVDGIEVTTEKPTRVGNYTVTTGDGALEVTPKDVTVTTESASKEYDGEPLINPNARIEGLVEGESATVNATGEITEIGSVDNTYSITWGSNTKDGNYNVNEVLGKLTITVNGDLVTLTAPSDSKIYDGTALTCNGNGQNKVTWSGLPEGFTVRATASGSQTDAGRSANTVDDGYTIYNKSGSDKTANFTNVTKAPGWLTVYPRVTIAKVLSDPLISDAVSTFRMNVKIGNETNGKNYDVKPGDNGVQISSIDDLIAVGSAVTVSEVKHEIYETVSKVIFKNGNSEETKATGTDSVRFELENVNEVKIIFTNTRKTKGVTVVKNLSNPNISDSKGDEFDFNATLKNGNNVVSGVSLIAGSTEQTNSEGTIAFKVSAGDANGVSLNVPVGASLTITENAPNYRTTIKGDGEESIERTTYNIEPDKPRTVTYTNYRDAYLKLENFTSKGTLDFRVELEADKFVGEQNTIYRIGEDRTATKITKTSGYFAITLERNDSASLCLPYAAGFGCKVTIYNEDGTKADEIMLNRSEKPLSTTLQDSTVSGTLTAGALYEDGKGFDEEHHNVVSIIDKLVFNKIDGKGVALEGAEFTLFAEEECTTVVAKGESKKAEESSTVATVVFDSPLAVGTPYFMKETKKPVGDYQDNNALYRVTYEVDESNPEKSGFKIEVKNEGEGDFVSYNGNTIVNIFTTKRKAILRKVLSSGGKYESLSGAVFTLYYADGKTEVKLDTAVKDAEGNPTNVFENLKSEANGIIWIGMLPIGIYYLHETGVPEGASGDKPWFVVKVTDKGVEQPIKSYATRPTIEELNETP